MSLAHNSKDFQGGMLVAGAMYIVLCLNLRLFNREEVITHFSNSSLYLLEESIQFNKTFSGFINACFNIGIDELIPFVQYASRFFSMELDNCLPHHWSDECALEVKLNFNDF